MNNFYYPNDNLRIIQIHVHFKTIFMINNFAGLIHSPNFIQIVL